MKIFFKSSSGEYFEFEDIFEFVVCMTAFSVKSSANERKRKTNSRLSKTAHLSFFFLFYS